MQATVWPSRYLVTDSASNLLAVRDLRFFRSCAREQRGALTGWCRMLTGSSRSGVAVRTSLLYNSSYTIIPRKSWGTVYDHYTSTRRLRRSLLAAHFAYGNATPRCTTTITRSHVWNIVLTPLRCAPVFENRHHKKWRHICFFYRNGTTAIKINDVNVEELNILLACTNITDGMQMRNNVVRRSRTSTSNSWCDALSVLGHTTRVPTPFT